MKGCHGLLEVKKNDLESSIEVLSCIVMCPKIVNFVKFHSSILITVIIKTALCHERTKSQEFDHLMLMR